MTDYTLSAVTWAFVVADPGTTTLRHLLPVSMTDGVTVAGDTPAYTFFPGAEWTDTLTLGDTMLGKAIYGLVTADTTSIRAMLSAGYVEYLAEDIGVHDALSYVLAVAIAENLLVRVSTAASALYGMTMAEVLLLNDGMFNFFLGALADGIGIHDTLGGSFFPAASVEDGVVLGSVMGNSLLLQAEVDEGVTLDDTQLLNMVYAGDPLLDSVRITAGYVAPDGSFTTWAINTRNNFVTEYQNWDFNSFAKMGHKYLGANSEGLFELNGNDDAGANIPTSVLGGLLSLGGSKFTSFKAAYLGMRVYEDAPDDVFLRLIDGQGNVYVYAVQPNDMSTTRVDMGKGLRQRYFQWQLTSVAADYDLDAIEFIPLISKRRI